MRKVAKNRLNGLLLPGLALVALALLSCEPGESLDPLPEEKPIPKDSSAVPKVTATSIPAQIRPGDTVEVTVTVVDSFRNAALANTEISVSSSQFTVLSTDNEQLTADTTDSDGRVSFKLTSGAVGAGTVNIRVRTPARIERSLSLSLAVVEQPVKDARTRNLVFQIMRADLKADGTDSTELRVLVKDDNSNPIAGEKVTFTANGGLVTPFDITDDGGRASGWLVSERINKKVTVIATLVSQGISSSQTVTFSGVAITINADDKVLMQGNSTEVIFELKDANEVPIAGDTLEIAMSGNQSGFGGSGRDSLVVVTDTRGQYKTVVQADALGEARIRAYALGAQALQTLFFTNERIVMSSNRSSIVGDGLSTATISIHLADDDNKPISGADMRWTTTFGEFTTQPFTRTDAEGRSSIVLRSGRGTGLATVHAEAKKGGKLIASGAYTVKVTAQRVHRLEFKVTPDNIPVSVGEANLIAQAYDMEDNIVEGALIGFRLIKGAGGGDEVIKPPVSYTESGVAKSAIQAGGVISFYQSVRLAAVALEIDGADTLVVASSDTVGLTISGPPHRISVGHDIFKGENPKDGTFGLPASAVVTDVNGNLVADGTPVNFSAQPIGMTIWRKGATLYRWSWWYSILDSVPEFLPWSDYNFNGRLDAGEEPSIYNSGNPYRGEDRDGNGVINEGEWFDDINNNGLWDTLPEPFYVVRFSDLADSVQAPADSGAPGDSSGGYGGVQAGDTVYADYNRNGRLDLVEPWLDGNGNGRCDCAGQYDANGDLIEYRYYTNSNVKKPFPGQVAVGISKEVATLGGKAVNKIKYVQSDALRVNVRVSAEANGRRSTDDFLLPVILAED